MRLLARLAALSLFLFAAVCPAVAQQNMRTSAQPLDTSVSNKALTFDLFGDQAVMGVNVTGLTASGATLTIEGSTDARSDSDPNKTWFATVAMPFTCPSPLTFTTLNADQPFKIDVSGLTNLRFRVSSTGTGSALIGLNAIPGATLGTCGGSGGGGGSVPTGTAGSPNASVVTVQGITGATPLNVAGTFSASLSGFLPTPAYTSAISVSSTNTSTALPTNTGTVVAYNVGSKTAYVTLASGTATASTAKDAISPGGCLSYATTGFDHIGAITAGSDTTTLNVSGGSGLGPNCGGGGASGGGGGAVTLASGAVASGAYSSGAFASGSIASGAAVSGAFVSGAIADLAISQGHSITSQVGNMVYGEALTAAPTYTTAQLYPFTMTTAGAERTDLSSVAGTTALTGTGAVGAGAQRVAVGTDTATIAGSAPGTAGTASTNVISVQGIASMTPVQVSQATASNLNVTATLAAGSNTVGSIEILGHAGATLDSAAGTGISQALAIQGVSGGVAVPVTGTLSASIGAFAPTPGYASLSVSNTSSRVALPTGTDVVVYNTGSNPAYLLLGNSSVTATTSDDVLLPNSWTEFAVGSAVDLAAITSSSTTTLTISGGAGIAAGSVGYPSTQTITGTVNGGGTAGTANTGVLTVQGIASMTPVQVSQATASNLNATVIGAGTAGTANAGVVTVQGIASMTPVQVSQATAASLNATVVGTGTFATQSAITAASGSIASGALAAGSISSGAAVSGAFVSGAIADLAISQGHSITSQVGNMVYGEALTAAPTYTTAQLYPFTMTTAGAERTDTSSIGGTTVLTGTGAVGAGAQRIAVGTDTATIAGSAPGTAGTASSNVLSVQGIASMTPVQVSQATASNLNATVVQGTASNLKTLADIVGNGGATMDIAQGGGTAATNALQVGGVYNTSALTLTNGQAAALQFGDAAGDLNVRIATCASGVCPANVSNASSGVATSSTNSPVVGYLFGYNGTTWDQIKATSNAMNVDCVTGCSSTSTIDEASFSYGTNSYVPVGGVYNASIANLSSGQGGVAAMTTDRNLFVNLNKVGGSAVALGQTTMSASIPVAIASNQSALGVSLNSTPSFANGNGVVLYQGGALSATNGIYANILSGNAAIAAGNPLYVSPGTGAVFQVQSNSANLATAALQPTNAAVGSTSSGQTGTLGMGFVTTGAPTYTTAQTDPLSLDTAGNLRINCVTGCGGGSGGTAATDEAAFTAGTTSYTPMGGIYSTGSISLTSGQAGAVRLTATRHQMMDVEDVLGSAISATNGLYSNLLQGNAALSTSNPIFVTGTGTAGTAATNPITVQGIASMTPLLANPGTAANWGIGSTAATAPTTANEMGAIGLSADQTAVTTGQMVAPEATLNGKLINQPYALSPNQQSPTTTGQTGTGTVNVLAASGTSGIKEYMTSLQIGRSDAGTTAITAAITDGTSTYTFVVPNNGGGGGNNMTFPVPIAFAANHAVTCAASSGVTTFYCTAQGFNAP